MFHSKRDLTFLWLWTSSWTFWLWLKVLARGRSLAGFLLSLTRPDSLTSQQGPFPTEKRNTDKYDWKSCYPFSWKTDLEEIAVCSDRDRIMDRLVLVSSSLWDSQPTFPSIADIVTGVAEMHSVTCDSREQRGVGEGWTSAPADDTSHINNMKSLVAVEQRNPSFLISNETKTHN